MTTITTPSLREQLKALPDDAFTRLQYLAPAVGCLNRCAFCSQAAGREIWQFTAQGLSDLTHALADAAAERGITLAGGRIHRPGVIFPYLDNDIASYPHLDTYAALANYRPLFDRLGHGAATAAVELRFPPLLGIHPLTDQHILGHHVLHCGPHLLIAQWRGEQPPPHTEIERLDERNQPIYSQPGARYLHIVSDHAQPTPATVRAALAGCLTAPHRAQTVRLHRFTNADGDYYAADPDFHPDGHFTALHLYPTTERRCASGYTDATRRFLNTLLTHKAARGIGRRDEFPHASTDDIQAVLTALRRQAENLASVDAHAATHLRDQVTPLITTYATALHKAGYPPATFFSRAFTIDTGQIVNQGRAQGLFRGLAATNGEPMTPREERGFGQASLSTVRGPIWRITPLPHNPTRLPTALAGGKNPSTTVPTVLVEEMDPCHLAPVMRSTGCRLRRHTLTGVEIEHIDHEQGHSAFALPGLATK
ncbi:hypothetical protein [Peterkaempfera bronchialis]|uniref:hypothetical protein n=1 Tax=Peterkaempfera bronchialis TaxID=2126346 RepID=UPI003C2B1278